MGKKKHFGMMIREEFWRGFAWGAGGTVAFCIVYAIAQPILGGFVKLVAVIHMLGG